jgi:hypothetical protein
MMQMLSVATRSTGEPLAARVVQTILTGDTVWQTAVDLTSVGRGCTAWANAGMASVSTPYSNIMRRNMDSLLGIWEIVRFWITYDPIQAFQNGFTRANRVEDCILSGKC